MTYPWYLLIFEHLHFFPRCLKDCMAKIPQFLEDVAGLRNLKQFPAFAEVSLHLKKRRYRKIQAFLISHCK